MAITVSKLFKDADVLYEMKFIAGKNGLDNLIQWVHIIEDVEVSNFLHGQEVVFTAGILNVGGDWLLDFAKRIYMIGATAFIINIGPHTKEVTQEVIDYCDEVGMPLFTIPWHIKMVDITRDFCHRIIKNEDVEISISTTIKNIIFGIGDLETQIAHMERYGYKRYGKFSFVAISLYSDKNKQEDVELLKYYAEIIARNIHELYVAFSYQREIILALVDYTSKEVEMFIDRYIKMTYEKIPKEKINIGVSANMTNLANQQSNFHRALEALKMAKIQNKKVVYYDNLGVYKLLLSVDNKATLKSFYKETIGKIKVYDDENNTDLTSFLRVYLENNGSPQLVSEKQYIHRNTVTNQLKKIFKITGLDPTDLEDRVSLYLGFYISDIS